MVISNENELSSQTLRAVHQHMIKACLAFVARVNGEGQGRNNARRFEDCQYLADVQVMEHRGLITERGSIRLK